MPTNNFVRKTAAGVLRRRLLATSAAVCGLTVSRASTSGLSAASIDSTTRAELERAAQRGTLCSPTNVNGAGLRGEYFARRPGPDAPLLVRIDATVDFDRSLDWPKALTTTPPGFAVWSGWIKPPLSGRYRFHVDHADARLVIARSVLIGKDVANVPELDLAAGRYYPISLEVDRLETLASRLKLEWTAPYGARYVVPRALLYVPSDRVGIAGKS